MVDTAKLRRPDFSTAVSKPSGRVVRDSRGNAVWEWSRESEALEAQLTPADTAVAEVATAEPKKIRVNKAAAKAGYNPYESGLIEKAKRAQKRKSRAAASASEKQKEPSDDTKV
jgi:hypothetical protein